MAGSRSAAQFRACPRRRQTRGRTARRLEPPGMPSSQRSMPGLPASSRTMRLCPVPKPLSIAATQALLGPDEALLMLLESSDLGQPFGAQTFVWLVTKNDSQWLQAAAYARRDIAEKVQVLRCGLDYTANGAARSDGKGVCGWSTSRRRPRRKTIRCPSICRWPTTCMKNCSVPSRMRSRTSSCCSCRRAR